MADPEGDGRAAGSLALHGVAKRFGGTAALAPLDLSVAAGEFLVVVGPSGCGKSTLLRLIAGLEDVSAGRIAIAGRDVTDRPPAERGVAMVFQSYALYPHMTAFENIAFGLPRARRRDPAALGRLVGETARLLQIDGLLARRPAELSGGQRQRVAIGRAIVRQPSVFLFDEPLSNLDAALRADMRAELKRLHERLGATIVYVTHDQIEAMTLADRIALLNAGRLEQVGRPLDLYHRPASRFVAGFLGAPRMNFCAVTVAARPAPDRVTVTGAGLPTLTLPVAPEAPPPGEPLTLGIRPEHLSLAAPPLAGDTSDASGDIAAATVGLIEPLGALTLVHLTLAGGGRLVAQIGEAEAAAIDRGTTVGIRIDPTRCHLFTADGRTLVGVTPSGVRS